MDPTSPPSRRPRSTAFWNPENGDRRKAVLFYPDCRCSGAGEADMKGTVHGSEGGVYRVRLDSGEILEASLRGRLKQEARTGDRVVIGDRVEVVTGEDGIRTIEAVDDRRSEIVRKGPGGRRPKVVAANVDRLVVVVAWLAPSPGRSSWTVSWSSGRPITWIWPWC